MNVQNTEIVNFWLSAARDYHCSKNLSTASKDKLFSKTREVINKILKADTSESQILPNQILQNFCQLKTKQFEQIVNLVNAMGERGLKKIDQLLHVITMDPHVRTNIPNAKFLALKPTTELKDSIEISDKEKKINVRKKLYEELQRNRILSNPTAEFIPLPKDIIHHLKSNYLDSQSVVRVNQTTKKLQENVPRDAISKADVIKMINDERIHLRDLNLCTIEEIVDFFGKDLLDTITTLTVGTFSGIIADRSYQNSCFTANYLKHEVSTTLIKAIIKNFPKLNKLYVYDKLDKNLIEALSTNKLQELKNLTSLESITFANMEGVKSLDFLKKFPKLTFLSIQGCKDLGTIDAHNYFSKIKHLSLRSFNSVKNLETLTQLETLFLKPQGNFKLDFSNLKNLKDLNFSACQEHKDDVRFIGLENLVELEKLELRVCEDLNLESLKNLEFVSLIDCSGSISGLDKLHRLKDLNILRCENLHDYNFLTQMPELKVLTADKLEYNTEFIKYLKNLEDLFLQNFERPSLNFLQNLHSLKKLTIDDIKGVCNFQDLCSLSNMPLENLTILITGKSSLNFVNLDFLKKIPSLKSLRISINGNIKLIGLRNHPSLEKIHLRGCSFDDPESLMEIPTLKHADINETDIIEKLKNKGIKAVRGY